MTSPRSRPYTTASTKCRSSGQISEEEFDEWLHSVPHNPAKLEFAASPMHRILTSPTVVLDMMRQCGRLGSMVPVSRADGSSVYGLFPSRLTLTSSRARACTHAYLECFLPLTLLWSSPHAGLKALKSYFGTVPCARALVRKATALQNYLRFHGGKAAALAELSDRVQSLQAWTIPRQCLDNVQKPHILSNDSACHCVPLPSSAGCGGPGCCVDRNAVLQIPAVPVIHGPGLEWHGLCFG